MRTGPLHASGVAEVTPDGLVNAAPRANWGTSLLSERRTGRFGSTAVHRPATARSGMVGHRADMPWPFGAAGSGTVGD